MTTVAFIAYRFQGADRRLGPMSMANAEPMAREFSRKFGVTEVVLEEWTCTDKKRVLTP